jgi:hypothetical protein
MAPLVEGAAMGWIIAAVVVVALGALTWWSSGRAKPFGRRLEGPNDDPRASAARAQAMVNREARGPNGNLGGP